MMPSTQLAFISGLPGWSELLILAFVGLLIFGKRLPEVGKNLGKGIVEFKKGLSGIEEDVKKIGDKPPRLDSDSATQHIHHDDTHPSQ